jgi:glycosyltransferase involved in cell wall biosynthesis
MKIVYLYHALAVVGGIERVMIEKANYLAERCGYEVWILTTDQGNNTIPFPLSNKVKHIDLGINFVNRHHFPMLKRLIIHRKDRRDYKEKLKQLFLSIHPDVIIFTTYLSLDLYPPAFEGSVRIVESHVAKEYAHKEHSQKNLFRRILAIYLDWRINHHIIKKCDALVVLTEKDVAWWKKIKKATVIPNLLPFCPEKTSTCTNKKVISVGRLSKQKGFDLLIRVWKIVSMEHQDWSLYIYGSGELRNDLIKEIGKEGLSDSMIIEKPVPDIQNKYTDSSIYVLSSRYEGFAMVLIEAMVCGLPIVSFDCPNGPSEIIKNGENGFLIKEGNIEAMANKICYLIDNEEKRISMGKNACQNVKQYMPELIMQKWIDLFSSLKKNDK